jgi:hypothetical protein
VRNARDGQVFLGGSGGKSDGRLNVLSLQARKIDKDVIGRIPIRQAGKYGSQSDTRALEHGFAAADRLVADDALFGCAS